MDTNWLRTGRGGGVIYNMRVTFMFYDLAVSHNRESKSQVAALESRSEKCESRSERSLAIRSYDLVKCPRVGLDPNWKGLMPEL